MGMSSLMHAMALSVPTTAAAAPVHNFGLNHLPGGSQHWLVKDEEETALFTHNINNVDSVGILTQFWIEAGRQSRGRYLCDTMIIRYYIDNETEASLTFTPSMAAGSGVGLEPFAYYQQNGTARFTGNVTCRGGVDGCGMDLLDGWPWQTAWTGKGGSEGNWILHFQVPFSASLRITAQVASIAAHPDFARPDIARGSQASVYIMVRGLEGPEEKLRITLGNGLVPLPPVRTAGLRLRLQRLSHHTPARGEFVRLAHYPEVPSQTQEYAHNVHLRGSFGGAGAGAGAGAAIPDIHENKNENTNSSCGGGAVLMTTISFQGMHTIENDVELCWWALATPTARYNASAAKDGANALPLLIGTGMEDYFSNAFSLSWAGRTYHNDDAGLTHIRGGPVPAWDPVGSKGRPFPSLFSAYRMFRKDPLLFDGRLELSFRYLPPAHRKCSLETQTGAKSEVAPALPTLPGTATVNSEPTVIDSYSWFYTWDN